VSTSFWVYRGAMVDGLGGEPHAPSAFLAGIGKGLFGRRRGVVTLERSEGGVWREVGRFGSLRDADRALDDAVANGAEPDSLRTVETSDASNRLLVIVGALVIGAAIAIMLYVAFG
jgi:hypothetical protein